MKTIDLDPGFRVVRVIVQEPTWAEMERINEERIRRGVQPLDRVLWLSLEGPEPQGWLPSEAGLLAPRLVLTALQVMETDGRGRIAYEQGSDFPRYHDMAKEQAHSYHSVQSALWDKASKDRSYLSAWLQWSLARPNSAFRKEVVRELGNRVLPAVITGKEMLPKEQWLVDFCKAEAAQGRRVVVFVRQTGTRDIQPRLVEILTRAGLNAGHLPRSISPRKREAWIKAHPYQVLVTNPRLVETGLDLVEYSSIVFFEIEYSLYTLWQAMRRVWRLGQKKPVKVVFAVYRETLEEQAMRLMGQKMRAAQLLYGDEVGGAIVPESGADSFLTELARSVLEEAELPDLKALFGATAKVATVQAPLPAERPSLAELRRRMAEAQAQTRRRRKKRSTVPAGQLPLFSFA